MPNNNDRFLEQVSDIQKQMDEKFPDLDIPPYIAGLAPGLKIAAGYTMRRYTVNEAHVLLVHAGKRTFDVGLPIWPIHIFMERGGRRWVQLAWHIFNSSGYSETITHIFEYRGLADSRSCLAALASVGYPITSANATHVSRWIADVITYSGNIIPSTVCATGYEWDANDGITLWQNRIPVIREVGKGMEWELCESPVFGGDPEVQVNALATLWRQAPICRYIVGAFLSSLSTPDMPEFFDFRPCHMLDGAANTGKSFLLYLGCSLFGNPRVLKQPAKGTHLSKEWYCSTMSRIPAVFDEMRREDGIHLVELADGHSKPGMTVNNTPRASYNWDCGIFLSGNHNVDLAHVGSRARLVAIPFPGDYSTFPEMDDAEYHRFVTSFQTNYGHIAREYFIAYKGRGGINAFREEYDRALYDLQTAFTDDKGHCAITTKILHTIAAAMAAAEMAGIIFDLTPEGELALTVDQICDLLHLDKVEAAEEVIDPATEVLEAVWSFIATNTNNVQNSINKVNPIYAMGDTLAKIVKAPDGREMAWLTNDGLIIACKNVPNAGDAANIRRLLARTSHFYVPTDKNGNKIKGLTSRQRIGKRNGLACVTGVYLPDSAGDEE